jgi:hypothetical protein
MAHGPYPSSSSYARHVKGHGVVFHIFPLLSNINFKIKKQVQYVPQDTKYM